MLIWRMLTGRRFAFGLRLVLGATLLMAGLEKLPNGAGLVDLVSSLAILPQPWAHYYAVALPWAEVIIGSCLILGLFSTLMAGAGIAMLLTFLVANAKSLTVNLHYSNCGCFGQIVEIPGWVALTLDSIMIGMALLILFRSGESLSVDSWLVRCKSLRSTGSARAL